MTDLAFASMAVLSASKRTVGLDEDLQATASSTLLFPSRQGPAVSGLEVAGLLDLQGQTAPCARARDANSRPTTTVVHEWCEERTEIPGHRISMAKKDTV